MFLAFLLNFLLANLLFSYTVLKFFIISNIRKVGERKSLWKPQKLILIKASLKTLFALIYLQWHSYDFFTKYFTWYEIADIPLLLQFKKLQLANNDSFSEISVKVEQSCVSFVFSIFKLILNLNLHFIYSLYTSEAQTNYL